MVIRFAAILLVASAVFAAGPENWTPVRWQGGPAELARRNTNDPSFREILRDWYAPRMLELFRDTPVNCLLATWSSGGEAAIEAEQQKLVSAFASAAHDRRIAVLGVIYPGSDPRKAAEASLDAGLDGLVLEGDLANQVSLARDLLSIMKGKPVIPLGALEALELPVAWPVLGTSDAVMPRIVVSDSDAVVATTTSEPWIDSNTWLVRSVRSWSGARPIWLGNRLEKPTTTDYVRAIADAEVAGGRWVITLDDELMSGLWRGQAAALAAWRSIVACTEFYQQHSAWRSFAPAAPLGIVRDRDLSDKTMSDENLKLVYRRRVPYRIIERSDLSSEAIAGLMAVLATDLAPPTDAERKVMTVFAERGGLTIGGPSWGSPAAEGFVQREAGKGSIVIYKDDPPDPEALAKDVLDLLGSNNLPLRLFNCPSVLTQASRGPGGTSLLVQLVNYAGEPSEMVTVRALGDYRRAWLHVPESAPIELKIENLGDRVEVRINRILVNAAILFEK
jgi:hypothetical protein